MVVNSTDFTEDYVGIEIDLSYKQPVGETLKFEAGYQGKLQDNPNTLNFDASVIDQSLDGVIQNESNLQRDIHAFFFEFEKDFNDKFSIKPSFRLESVKRKVTFNSTFHNDFDYEGSVLDNLIRDAQNESYDL